MSTVDKKKTKMRPTPSARSMKIAIIVAEWNKEITSKLLTGATNTIKKAGCTDYTTKWVPGTLELPLAAQLLLDNDDYDAIIALGCVVRGDTPHFDYVCQGAFDGLMRVQLEFSIPITFGILTTENYEQALDRAGGKLGNKGSEAAEAAIKMADFQDEVETEFYENELNSYYDDELPNFIPDDDLLN